MPTLARIDFDYHYFQNDLVPIRFRPILAAVVVVGLIVAAVVLLIRKKNRKGL